MNNIFPAVTIKDRSRFLARSLAGIGAGLGFALSAAASPTDSPAHFESTPVHLDSLSVSITRPGARGERDLAPVGQSATRAGDTIYSYNDKEEFDPGHNPPAISTEERLNRLQFQGILGVGWTRTVSSTLSNGTVAVLTPNPSFQWSPESTQDATSNYSTDIEHGTINMEFGKWLGKATGPQTRIIVLEVTDTRSGQVARARYELTIHDPVEKFQKTDLHLDGWDSSPLASANGLTTVKAFTPLITPPFYGETNAEVIQFSDPNTLAFVNGVVVAGEVFLAAMSDGATLPATFLGVADALTATLSSFPPPAKVTATVSTDYGAFKTALAGQISDGNYLDGQVRVIGTAEQLATLQEHVDAAGANNSSDWNDGSEIDAYGFLVAKVKKFRWQADGYDANGKLPEPILINQTSMSNYSTQLTFIVKPISPLG